VTVDTRFESSLFTQPYVVETRSGDLLTREPLLELRNNEQLLRKSKLRDWLASVFDLDNRVTLHNIFTIADVVDMQLTLIGIDVLAAATEDEVKIAVSAANWMTTAQRRRG
jgi:hypothetical protein